MSTRRRGRTRKYPSGLSGPKCPSIVFSSDVKPMVDFTITANNTVNDNNFHVVTSSGIALSDTGGINYVAAQFKITGGYVSEAAALRTLYRVLHEAPIMGAHIADALALACETSLYTEDIREYPSRLTSAREIVFTEADELGQVLTPFDLEERATLLWHETYDRFVVEMEPFRDKYEADRVRRKQQRSKLRDRLTLKGPHFGALA